MVVGEAGGAREGSARWMQVGLRGCPQAWKGADQMNQQRPKRRLSDLAITRELVQNSLSFVCFDRSSLRYHVLLLKSRQVQVKSNHNTVQLAQLTCEVGWNQTRSTTRILVGNLCNPCIFPTNEIQPLSHFSFKDTCKACKCSIVNDERNLF